MCCWLVVIFLPGGGREQPPSPSSFESARVCTVIVIGLWVISSSMAVCGVRQEGDT